MTNRLLAALMTGALMMIPATSVMAQDKAPAKAAAKAPAKVDCPAVEMTAAECKKAASTTAECKKAVAAQAECAKAAPKKKKKGGC